MKRQIPIIISFLLAVAIIAPSVISLTHWNENMEIAMDYGEDESQKEGKDGEKENNDQDTFYHFWNNAVSSFNLDDNLGKMVYLEERYDHILNVFLPPPKFS